jgi:hypothetical protein
VETRKTKQVANRGGQAEDPPGSRAKSIYAWPGSTTTRGQSGARAGAPHYLAFRLFNTVGTPELLNFRGSMACPLTLRSEMSVPLILITGIVTNPCKSAYQ